MILSGQEKFLCQKIFIKKLFWSKFFGVKLNFDSQKIGLKTFWVKKILDKKNLGQRIFLTKNCFLVKKIV